MKICAISTGFASWAGGPEIALQYLSQYWTRKGHEVYILCGAGPRNGPEGAKIIKLPFISRRYFDKIPGLNRILFFLPTFELESLSLLPFLPTKLKRINPHIVLTVTVAETMVSLSLGFPTVMISQAGTWYRLRLYKKVDRVVVNEPISLSRLEKSGYKVSYILNGLEFGKVYPNELEELRKEYGIPEEGIKVLSVGRLDSQKRVHLLIEAFRLIEQKATLLIVGDGPEFPRLKRMSASMNNKVIFLGTIPHKKVLDLYQICDVFTLPSMKEAFGMVLIEALSSGKCVVTNPEPVKRFLLGKYGVYVDVENANAYAAGLLEAASRRIDTNSPEFREYVDQFRWERIASIYLDLFTQILQDRHISLFGDEVRTEVTNN